MSKLFQILVGIIFITYVVISQTIIWEYEDINDKLQAANDGLMDICRQQPAEHFPDLRDKYYED